ncbi:MAG: archease [Candidatus Omnitrophica bacterium]|nr:archease [Candidatus Omnitrophota bacterium]
MKPYEVFEHTADIGLKIYGRTFQELFRHGALGLFNLVTEVDALNQPDNKKASLDIELTGENAGDLFLKWLRELLFVFSTRKLILLSFNFKILTENKLKAEAEGIVFDPSRHEPKYEVKAVTYHQFKIEKKKTGWEAEGIFDI